MSSEKYKKDHFLLILTILNRNNENYASLSLKSDTIVKVI